MPGFATSSHTPLGPMGRNTHIISMASAQCNKHNMAYGVCSDCNVAYLRGFFIHNVFGGVVARAFARCPNRNAQAEESADVREQIKAKSWRLKCYAASEDRRKRACISLFLITHLDHLWRRLQQVETFGPTLQDLSLPRANIFTATLRAYMHLLAEPIGQVGMLAALFHEFGLPDTPAHPILMDFVREGLIFFCCHLWWRLHIPFSSYPYRLLRMVDSRLDVGTQRAEAHAFWHTPLCDLDHAFSHKLRRLYKNATAMFECFF